ncbi:MAG: DUF7368 family protein [Sciscionella sp.]
MRTDPHRVKLAEQATRDAIRVATDLRDVDPHQVWRRLQGYARTDPTRLFALTVALAAMIDVDRPVADLLAWTEPLRGGAPG